MKLAFFELEPWENKIISERFPKDKLVLSQNKFSAKIARTLSDIEVLSVFIYSKVDEEALNKMPKLKLITTRSTGFDHIDVKACKKRGIIVCNVPFYGENTVAEHTFALILSLTRKITECVERTKHGSFDLKGLRGMDLKGKTLGVVGGGNIGQHVIRIGKGFDMNVIVFDINQDSSLAKKIGYRYVSMNELLKNSDIVTLHVPYNQHTHHLINAEALAKMKPSALLINTARGGIVDTHALLKALKGKKIAGVGLDVLEEEGNLVEELELVSKNNPKKCDLYTIVEDHVLINMPNVIVTPHNAFNTHEAMLRILDTTFRSIEGLKKKRIVNQVKV